MLEPADSPRLKAGRSYAQVARLSNVSQDGANVVQANRLSKLTITSNSSVQAPLQADQSLERLLRILQESKSSITDKVALPTSSQLAPNISQPLVGVENRNQLQELQGPYPSSGKGQYGDGVSNIDIKACGLIAARAKACEDLLIALLQDNLSFESQTLDNQNHVGSVWPEEQIARFNMWASSLGVFALGPASIEHRLRDSAEIYNLKVQYL